MEMYRDKVWLIESMVPKGSVVRDINVQMGHALLEYERHGAAGQWKLRFVNASQWCVVDN
jgi:hypothetical protein